jgi:predicted thioesterase
MAIELGLKGVACCMVDEKNTAKSLRSGGLDVLATPIMVALMEEAALKSVRPYLEPGTDTVGTRLDVSHLSATPVGMKAWAVSELVEIDRRKLVFEVKAYDEAGLIGEGRHERFIVDIEKFTSKCAAKLAK